MTAATPTCARCPECDRLVAVVAGRLVPHTRVVLNMQSRLRVPCYGGNRRIEPSRKETGT